MSFVIYIEICTNYTLIRVYIPPPYTFPQPISFPPTRSIQNGAKLSSRVAMALSRLYTASVRWPIASLWPYRCASLTVSARLKRRALDLAWCLKIFIKGSVWGMSKVHPFHPSLKNGFVILSTYANSGRLVSRWKARIPKILCYKSNLQDSEGVMLYMSFSYFLLLY